MGTYYPETIVFVVDVCDDPGMDPGKHASRLELLKQCIGMFAQAKSRVNPGHKYGLAIIRDTVQWEGVGVNASPEGLLTALRAVQPLTSAAGSVPTPTSPPLDLGAVVALVQPLAVAEEADGGKVRVVLVYGRSTVVPVWTTRNRPGEQLCVDVLFVHDKAAAAAAAEAAGPGGCASPQDVYSWLEENVDVLSGRCNHNSYIFEAGSLFVKKVPHLMVSLIGHPLQRPPQRALRTAPLDLATIPPQPTSAAPSTFTSPSSSNANPASAPPLDSSAFPPLPGFQPAAASTPPPPAAVGTVWSPPRRSSIDAGTGHAHAAFLPAGAATGTSSAAHVHFSIPTGPATATGYPGPPALQPTPPRLDPPVANLIDMADSPPPQPLPPAPAAPPPNWPAPAHLLASPAGPMTAAAAAVPYAYPPPTAGGFPGVPGASGFAVDGTTQALAGVSLSPGPTHPGTAGGAAAWPAWPMEGSHAGSVPSGFPGGAVMGAAAPAAYVAPPPYGVLPQ